MATAKALTKAEQLYNALLAYMKNGVYDKAYECIEGAYKLSKKSGYRLVRAYRQSMKKIIGTGEGDVEKNYELLHRSYVLTARDIFDDFMIALEWYRPIEKRFWLPRRDKLLTIANALQELADDELDELFISQPPRTGKSTLVMFFLIWMICRDPDATNLYSSYTKDVVDIFYNGILEVMQDPDTYDLLTIFPKATVVATNAAIGSINVGRKTRYPSVMLRAINQALNGLADASGLILIDDIHSGIDEARNPDLLLKTWSTIANNLLARRKNGTKHIWIGTRWSIYDAISKRIEMLETESAYKGWRYKVVNVPALNENDESNFDYPYGLGFSTESYKRVRSMFYAADDSASWLAQYCGTPIERDGSVFEPGVMKYYNGELPKDEDPDRVFVVCDPSWGGGDYVAAVCCYQYGEEIFIPEVVYDNGDKMVTEPMLCDMAVRHQASAMFIEGTRVTGTYAEEVDNRLKGMGYRLSMQRTTKHWSSQSGKTQRIFDRAPEIKQRMVFLDEQHRTKSYQRFMQNVFSFTFEGKNKHDDAPDVLAMTLVMVQGRMNRARAVRRLF